MSKYLRVLLVVAVLASLIAFAPVHVAQAQNTQFPAYTSSIQIANLDTTEAKVVLIGYNADGTQSGSALNDTIAVNGSKTYFPISNVANGFSGSFVISSDKKVAAISNIVASDFAAGASYVGRSGGATKVLLPTLFKDNSGFFTWFSVQNAGTGDANVQIAYSDGVNASATIKPGAAKVFYQAAEAHTQKIFAATITSNQPVVAAAIQENPRIMFAYTGITGGSTNPVFPTINANNAGYQTGVQIQNAGTAATNVTVEYTPAGGIGTQCTETKTIQPNSSETFALRAFKFDGEAGTNENCAANVRFIGAARVTTNSTNQPLVGVVNQLGNFDGEAYNAFDSAEAGPVVVLPLIMDRNSGFFTGFNIQNVGAVATTVNCTFLNSGYTVSGNLAPNAALSDNQNGKIADRYIGAATCSSNPPSALVAVINQLRQIPNVDGLLVYEGVKK